MTNNDVLRRLRYTFNFNDQKVIAIFAAGEVTVARDQISNWLKKEDDPSYVNCPDSTFAAFLNGFINERRGKKDGAPAKTEKRLNNNIILTKLKIAFNLKAEDIIDMLALVGFRLSKPELSAFSRKADHKNYRECKDQVLRNFLQAVDKKFHVQRRAKVQKNNNNVDEKQDKLAETLANKNYKSAKANASKIYHNPNKTPAAAKKTERKVLKLKPKDIWGE
ncbi:Uncharacterized conserved protein YehS, DUF1456 family [Colwellia chukchiensis]|uniref:Uncharacterized conserved protein YehS, DUF1456 family n=1 Tax=Colwellia chukchiensis TaxID=641665 RepID=A0A1H7RZ45_9GAMM|nr:DUF1456 family protein [Colwellia chukchiensis]SEL65368.1 Uncharacterized conserved protein YehS, DUF1456 family [Colwellia chukchiensis]